MMLAALARAFYVLSFVAVYSRLREMKGPNVVIDRDGYAWSRSVPRKTDNR